jgi:hypothetical protein
LWRFRILKQFVLQQVANRGLERGVQQGTLVDLLSVLTASCPGVPTFQDFRSSERESLPEREGYALETKWQDRLKEGERRLAVDFVSDPQVAAEVSRAGLHSSLVAHSLAHPTVWRLKDWRRLLAQRAARGSRSWPQRAAFLLKHVFGCVRCSLFLPCGGPHCEGCVVHSARSARTTPAARSATLCLRFCD